MIVGVANVGVSISKPFKAEAGVDLSGIVPLYLEVTFFSNYKKNRQVPSISGPITIISLLPRGTISFLAILDDD